MTQRQQGTVERAVRKHLRQLNVSVQDSGQAAMAVSLAQQIDSARGAVAAAAAVYQVRGILTDLEKAKADLPKKDAIDELSKRREERQAAEG